MDERIVSLLNEYIEEASGIEEREALKELHSRYEKLIPADAVTPAVDKLKYNIASLMIELVCLKEAFGRESTRRSTLFSDADRTEIMQVQKLIDNNLFTYHFQPIVRADNGDIYSYEALMRAKNMNGITPFHILKYAELTDRLGEVEQFTFLNVLHFIGGNKQLFGDRLVFINSMPSVKVAPDKESEIEKLLSELCERVVVEMTENSEYNETELNEIKEKYRSLNIRIAIDDYGTGYSNISNLLRYTPNYVKIDRSLLSGIHNNPNKKHFVREIIDFCHDNDILALAEGIENGDELRTVILLGADLIQGFYVAKPTPDIIQSIPFELKAEIRTYRQEREDGRRLKIYNAENGEHVSLDKLNKEGYSIIRIGSGYNVGNVTITGAAYLNTDLHIETCEDFKGRITLDSAHLSNLSERPCIDIGAKNEVTLILAGNNRLRNSGVRVPESSKLTLEGKGNLDIMLSGADYYGIGNDMKCRHGQLIFMQDGTISVSSESHAGVCIGSGMGGNIRIFRGRYVLSASGSMSVCIGAYDGDTVTEIEGCDIDVQTSGAYSTAIGSLNGSADINITFSSIKCRTDSQLAAAVGSVTGESAYIRMESLNMNIEMNADSATAFGALQHRSFVEIKRSSVKVKGDGAKVLLFGGLTGDTRVELADYDVSAEIGSDIDSFVLTDPQNILCGSGKLRVKLNGRETNEFR
ncbi:MAG: EAL domain-containing protein [Ruminiclostridium sp.]|nr:EAL domain-containing protein [Ruminiclostridium sp.]